MNGQPMRGTSQPAASPDRSLLAPYSVILLLLLIIIIMVHHGILIHQRHIIRIFIV
jgi:hypothetical protein